MDYRKYRMLKLAYEAALKGNAYRIVYNAANEVAVSEFIRRKIGFLDIPMVVERVMNREWTVNSFELKDILELDAKSRKVAEFVCSEIGKRD